MNFTSDNVRTNNPTNSTLEAILILDVTIFTTLCLLLLALAALICWDIHQWQQRRWLYAPSPSLFLLTGVSIFTMAQAQDPWDHVLPKYTGSTGTPDNKLKKPDKSLITVQHDIKEIYQVLKRVKKDGEHRWWEDLFGWSPTATGTLNLILHPIVILVTAVTLCLLLIIALYVRVWRMDKQVTLMGRFPSVYIPSCT